MISPSTVHWYPVIVPPPVTWTEKLARCPTFISDGRGEICATHTGGAGRSDGGRWRRCRIDRRSRKSGGSCRSWRTDRGNGRRWPSGSWSRRAGRTHYSAIMITEHHRRHALARMTTHVQELRWGAGLVPIRATFLSHAIGARNIYDELEAPLGIGIKWNRIVGPVSVMPQPSIGGSLPGTQGVSGQPSQIPLPF